MHRSRPAPVAASLALALALVVPTSSAAYAAPARVAQTDTVLTLSVPQSSYGQTVTATAVVVVPSGVPDGDVVFSVDGLARKTNLGASGTATLVLPKALVGEHAVSATYVPQFPQAQQGSSSPTAGWVVAPARSHLQVQVAGRRTRVPTSVRLRVDGDYGTRPTGRVRVDLRRAGGGRVARVGVRLDSTGGAVARLGRLRAGGYRVEVTYVGDSQHRRTRATGRFRVPRG